MSTPFIKVEIKKPQIFCQEKASGRRLGRFKIHNCIIDPDSWAKLLPLFAQMVIVRAEMRYDDDAIYYTAFSPLFEDLDASFSTPLYEITFNRETGEVSAEKSKFQ